MAERLWYWGMFDLLWDLFWMLLHVEVKHPNVGAEMEKWCWKLMPLQCFDRVSQICEHQHCWTWCIHSYILLSETCFWAFLCCVSTAVSHILTFYYFPVVCMCVCACTDSRWGTDDMNKCSLKSADGSSNLWNSVNPYGDPTYRWWQRMNPIRIFSEYFRLTPNHSYLKPTDLILDSV